MRAPKRVAARDWAVANFDERREIARLGEIYAATAASAAASPSSSR
jgi:hypothetical protein